VEELLNCTGRARVLLVLGPEWDGYSAGAMVDDVQLGLEHRAAWERLALVSDAEWIHLVAKLLGWLVPGRVRSFPYSKLDEATGWICG
jgi:hypothetical protein